MTETTTTRTLSITLPTHEAEYVERVAAAEGRSINELFEDSFRAYRAAEVRRLLGESQAEFRRAGLTGTEEEIEQMIQEEIQAVRQSKPR